jgi:hypothetical protein
MSKSRFVDDGEGIVWITRIPEQADERLDTQGTITEQSEES